MNAPEIDNTKGQQKVNPVNGIQMEMESAQEM